MYHIRDICAEDIPGLPDLVRQLGYEMTGAELEAAFSALADDATHKIYVAEADEGAVVGWVHVSAYKTLLAKKQAIILGMVVGSEYRRKGIGRLLMAKAELWAQEQNCAGIRLYSNVKRTAAHQFYQQLGYEIAADSLLFVKRTRE